MSTQVNRTSRKNPRSNPVIAGSYAVIGVMIPFLSGAGQFYNKDYERGLAITYIQLCNFFLFLYMLGYFTYPLFASFAIYDAVSRAKKNSQMGEES